MIGPAKRSRQSASAKEAAHSQNLTLNHRLQVFEKICQMAAPETTPAAPAALTEDQAAVYDRQLRVWGVEVQNRYASHPQDLRVHRGMGR